MIAYLVRWTRGRVKAPGCRVSLSALLQVLARRRTVCLRHPHRYHVGQVDDHAILAGLAVIPRTGQHQAAPLVQRAGDRLKRLAFAGEIRAYHGDVFTAHRVKSQDQHDVVRHRRSLPARTRKNARPAPGAVPRSAHPGSLWIRALSIVPRLRSGDGDGCVPKGAARTSLQKFRPERAGAGPKRPRSGRQAGRPAVTRLGRPGKTPCSEKGQMSEDRVKCCSGHRGWRWDTRAGTGKVGDPSAETDDLGWPDGPPDDGLKLATDLDLGAVGGLPPDADTGQAETGPDRADIPVLGRAPVGRVFALPVRFLVLRHGRSQLHWLPVCLLRYSTDDRNIVLTWRAWQDSNPRPAA
jgi:hypothetical protein